MCNFPYTTETFNGTTVCITYADYIGIDYAIYHAIFIIFAIISLLFIGFLGYNLCVNYDQIADKEYTSWMYIILLGMSICLLVQSIDPLSFSDVSPQIIDTLFSNLCTYLGLVGIFSVIITLLKKMNREYYRLHLKLAFYGIGLVGLVLTVIFSFFQVFISRYLWRGIKFTIFSTVIFILTIFIDYYLYRTLEMIRTLTGNSAPDSQFQKIKNKINQHMLLFNPFIALVFCFQVWSALKSFNRIGDTIKPYIGADDIFYPIAQFLGILLGVSFVFKQRESYGMSHQRLMGENRNRLTKLEQMLDKNSPKNNDIESPGVTAPLDDIIHVDDFINEGKSTINLNSNSASVV